MKKSLLLIFNIMMLLELNAQMSAGIEQYVSFPRSVSETGYSALSFFESDKGWYSEIRYNYDETGAISINGGRSYSFGKKVSLTFKPMVGIVVGSFTGLNFSLNHEAEWGRLFYSTNIQYMRSFRKETNSFFYSWFETGYSFSKNFFAGVSVQALLFCQLAQQFNKGFLFGFSSGKWSFPVYFFEPFNQQQSIVAGIIFNTEFKKFNK